MVTAKERIKVMAQSQPRFSTLKDMAYGAMFVALPALALLFIGAVAFLTIK